MRTRSSAGLQALLLATMLPWQVYRFFQQDVISPSQVYEKEESIDTTTLVQWPYLVACTIFLMEFMVCFVLILLLRLMLHFKDPSSGEVLFLTRLREVAQMLAFISSISGVYYAYKACHADQPLSMGSGSFFEGGQEYRQGARMLLWTLLAPQQWVMHARLYTKCTVLQSGQLHLSTALCMVFGMAAVQVDMSRTAWISPHWEVRMWFLLAIASFFVTLRRAIQLPLEPVAAKSGMFYLKLKCILWMGYPTIYLARTYGCISAWQEEVLGFTFLDVLTKSLSLIASSTGPLFALFISSWGNWHVSGGSRDIRVTVQDPTWAVISIEMDSSSGKGEQITGLTAGESNFLNEAVESRDRRRLVQIAKDVDAQVNFMAHKMPLTVHLAGGIEAQAECYVSRSLWGHRQLAISLEEDKIAGEDGFDAFSHGDVHSRPSRPESSRSPSSDSDRSERFALSVEQGGAETWQRLTRAQVALHHWNAGRGRNSASSENVSDPVDLAEHRETPADLA